MIGKRTSEEGKGFTEKIPTCCVFACVKKVFE